MSTERLAINTRLVRTEPRTDLLKGPNSAQEAGLLGAARGKQGDAGVKLGLQQGFVVPRGRY